ncbi:MAG: MAPEG family protein [Pseudomonadota bacterium]
MEPAIAIPVTAVVAALSGFWILFLSVVVIRGRSEAGASLGHGDHRPLERKIRAHGNMAETAPIFLILLAVSELQGAGAWWLGGVGAVFLVGRLAHGWALAFTPGNVPGRVGGMGLTLLALLMVSVGVLVQAVT